MESDRRGMVLEYLRPLPRPRWTARVIRWGMLFVAGTIFVAGVAAFLNPVLQMTAWLGGGTLGTPAGPLWGNNENTVNSVYLSEACGYLAIFLVMQSLFLTPHGGWRLDRLGGGKLTKRSAFAAGFVAMLLTIGLLATIMEIPGWWRKLTLINPGADRNDQRQTYWIIWIVLLATWLLWAWLFWVYARSLERFTGLSRILRFLVAGTFVELIVAAPVHAWMVAHSDEDCYCTRGSYTGVVFGCTALVWVFGPGVVLLLMRELRRREKLMNPTSPQAHEIP